MLMPQNAAAARWGYHSYSKPPETRRSKRTARVGNYKVSITKYAT
jgi:hypothetical protein